MKHIDCRVLVLLALPLAPAAARAQFVGQANDAAEVASIATSMGEIRMPSDPSAAPVTRTIEADFYGDADVDDWYRLNVVDEPISTSCFDYGHAWLEVILPTPTSGVSLQGIWLDTVGTLAPQSVNAAGGNNPFRLVANYGGSSCGLAASAYVLVRRDAGVATPIPYTLKLTFHRDFSWPSITGFSPTSGPVGTAVTIAGLGLIPAVKFGGIDAPITNSSSTSITTSVPAGAKTGPISVNLTPSQQVFTVTAPPVVGPGRQVTTTLAAASACCTVAPNPALVGRLGKLVVAFPQAAVPNGTKVAVVKDGRELQTGYGSQSWELLPGSYDLSVSGKTITNVSVQARSDTTVRVGVLRVSAGSQTQWEVVDGGKTIASGYGMQLVGLPVGSYSLRISGQTESFTIRDGQIADF
jgi:hypothetical protein